MAHRRKGRQLLEDVISLEFITGHRISPPTDVSASVGSGLIAIPQLAPTIVQECKLVNLVVPITDTGGVSGGFGSKALFTFPAKRIYLLGAAFSLSVVAAAGITATATVNTSLGSAAEAADSTLNSTQADYINSVATVLVASAGSPLGTGALLTPIVAPVLNASGGTSQVFLNFGVLDAGISANSSLTVNGAVRFIYIELV